MDSLSNEETDTKNWIQRLKEESWEAELLVSAVAIFGAFQMFDVVEWATFLYLDFLHPEQYTFGFIIVLTATMAVSILVCMFVIHFALRSYWVGLVGLNSVFPDFNIKDSVHSEIYTKRMLGKVPPLKDSILEVDELCSVIFSAAFSFLMVYLFASISLTAYLLLYNLLSPYAPTWVLLAPIALAVFVLSIHTVLSIIANFKSMHGNSTVQNLYYRTTIFTNATSYGPLFKNIMQVALTFSSNYKRKKGIVILMLAFFTCGMIYAVFKAVNSDVLYLEKTKIFSLEHRYHFEYYGDQNTDMDLLITPELPSDVVNDNVVRLFIPLLNSERRRVDTGHCESQDNQIDSREERRIFENQRQIDCYHQYHSIHFNGEPLEASLLRSHHHRTKQRGLVTYITLGPANIGQNTIKVTKTFDDGNATEWTIPFLYTPNNQE